VADLVLVRRYQPTMQLVWPAAEYLHSYVAALERGWSADNVRGEVAAQEELAKIRADPVLFLSGLVDREAKGSLVTLPDGSPTAASSCSPLARTRRKSPRGSATPPETWLASTSNQAVSNRRSGRSSVRCSPGRLHRLIVHAATLSPNPAIQLVSLSRARRLQQRRWLAADSKTLSSLKGHT
jgi:hypothetical protein